MRKTELSEESKLLLERTALRLGVGVDETVARAVKLVAISNESALDGQRLAVVDRDGCIVRCIDGE